MDSSDKCFIYIFSHRKVTGFRKIVFLFKNCKKLSGKFPVEIDVSQHIPGIAAADHHIGDLSVFIGGQTVFFCGTVCIQCGIAGMVLIGLKNIFRIVIVGGTDIAVSQVISGQRTRTNGCSVVWYSGL